MDAVLETDYHYIIVESYYESGSGLHGDVHVRPLPNQDPYLPSYRVSCSKNMRDKKKYPVPTKFRIFDKVTNREGSPLVYTNPKWPFTVV